MQFIYKMYHCFKSIDWISLILTMVISAVVIMIGIVTISYVG